MLSKTTVNELGAKLENKRAIWRFLCNECRWYLPGEPHVTIWYLRDKMRKKRGHIKCDDVKFIHLPQYEGLEIKNLLRFAREYPEVMFILPEDEGEIKKLPREWLGNVIYTKCGEPFQQWVTRQIDARNEKLKKEQELEVELDPEILEILKASTYVASKYRLERFGPYKIFMINLVCI